MERSRRDEQDVIGAYVAVARLYRRAFDDRQQIALHPFARDVGPEVWPRWPVILSISSMKMIAGDGAEGLALYGARQGELDLVITDLVMPKVGGMQLYEAIRQKEERVKVLFTSGYPVPQVRSQLGEDPRVAFVTKPWTAGELLGEVRALLDRS